MARKVFNDIHIHSIADRIRFNIGTNDKYTTAQMPQEIDRACAINWTRGQRSGIEQGREEGYQEGYIVGQADGLQAGIKSQYDKFWDKFQRLGGRADYRNAFYDWYWNNTIYEPKYPIICTGVSSEMMRYSEISDTLVPITFTHANSQYVFANNSYLKRIVYLEVTENVTFIGWFASCPELEEVNMSGVIGQNIDFSVCTKLKHESIIAIFSCLKQLSSGVTRTITIGAENLAKLTDAEKTIAIDKGWTLL